jgi:putative endonuclease
MDRQYYVYIVSNRHNTVLYTGVTGDLVRRLHEHRAKPVKSFSARYNLDKLVYYEVADNPTAAIMREKQIKAGSRSKKIELVNGMNPAWRDLAQTLQP